MRKFLIRWWWTSGWQRERQKWLRADDMRSAMTTGEIQQRLSRAISDAIDEMKIYAGSVDGTPVLCLREGQEWVMVNPFAPEQEWITVEEFRARQREFGEALISEGERLAPTLRVTKIDVKSKTVTLGSEPGRECVDPGWQATLYDLRLQE